MALNIKDKPTRSFDKEVNAESEMMCHTIGWRWHVYRIQGLRPRQDGWYVNFENCTSQVTGSNNQLFLSNHAHPIATLFFVSTP